MKTFRILTSSVFVILLGASPALAAVFPDVPDDHVFKESVEELVRAGVITGNPDGTFKPNDPVNRAAMLKMLYLAKGKVPDPLSVRCFPDVEIGSWYEPYVCDAAVRKYVNGYADGSFRPDTSVNRVEALKMITTVFGIPLEEVTDNNREIVNFADVSLSAWYTQYLLTAYNTNILPVPGQTGAHFFPDGPLTRGEAAAYIYNALRADLSISRHQNSRSSQGSSYSSQQADSVQSSAASSESSSEEEQQPGTIDVEFPFDKDGKFSEKNPVSYRFEVVSETSVALVAKLQSGQPGQLTCRLYLLEDSGFSDEYFLGFQEGNACYVTATLNPGTYQLQLQPTQANTTYEATVTVQSGDGNDGFADARSLTVNAERTDILGGHDMEDWYTFSLQTEQKMMIRAENPTELRCIVYAMSDVNLASFSGPQCNQWYTYPPGTYYIAIGRKAPLGAQQSYAVELEK